MKKVLILAAFAASFVANSFGATYGGNCGNVDLGTASNPSGVISILCPNFNVVSGEQLTSYSLEFLGTYSGASSQVADSARFTFTVVTNGSFSSFSALANPYTTSAAAIPGPEPTSQIGGTSAITNAVTNLQTGLVTGASGSASFQTLFGFLPSSNFNFTLNYSATSVAIPTNGEVPEPSTVALIGAGLVGVAAAARRRRS